MRKSAEDVRTEGDQAPGRRRLLLIGLVALALLVAAAIGTWQVRQVSAPTLLGARTGATGEVVPNPLSRSATFATIASPYRDTSDETLIFHRAPLVHFHTNTAAATARVAVCLRAPNAAPFLAARTSDLHIACSKVRYIKKGTRMHWEQCCSRGADPREYLIIVLTPSRPGVATVDRVTYDYERESGESGVDIGTLEFTISAT
jgi:hypothetical protein